MPVSMSDYGNAIYSAGVAERAKTPTHHDIPAKGQFVRDRVLQGIKSLGLTGTDHLKSGPQVPVFFGKVGPKSQKIVDTAIKIHSPNKSGQISIIFVGESHKSESDHLRSQDVMTKIGKTGAYDDLVLVYERKLKYERPFGFTCIDEDVLGRSDKYFGESSNSFGIDKIEPDNRTIVVAGYMFAYCASDDQRKNVVFVVFFGDRHADMAKQFEYFVTAGARIGIDWVEKRARGYFHAPALG